MSPIAAPALASSLTAFVVVYVLVFGAGVFYLLRLMRRPPLTAEPELEHVPIRTAGITPASALDPGHPA
jgi:cytochrome d ubiquinol oxidase subunit I